MLIFKLTYDNKDEEVKLTTSEQYNNMDKVIKLDCLQDAIHELQDKYEREFTGVNK